MENFLKKILSFLKKSYPKPVIVILVLAFLISGYIAYQETKSGILKLEEAISVGEKNLTEKDKEIEPQLEEFRTLNCNEGFISDILSEDTSSYLELVNKYRKEYGEEKFSRCRTLGWEIGRNFNTHNFILNHIQETERELTKKQQTSFLLLWSRNFFQSTILVILISLILLPPILKFLFQLVLRIKKQTAMMSTFQKYLIGLIFCILIILIFILIKTF